jgi:hypothetical protein
MTPPNSLSGVTSLSLFRLFLLAMAVASVGSAIPVNAQQISPLSDVPEAIATAQPSLVAQRAALEQERNDLRGKFARQKAQCSAVDERDTAKIASCTEIAQILSAALGRHVKNSEEFNRLLSKVTTELPSPFRHSPHGLIGGMTWDFGTYAMNVPQNLTGEKARLAREEAEHQFRLRLERAGIDYLDLIDPQQYDFIIGVAASSNPWEDLAKRVILDDLVKGRATPALQKEYNLIRGRSFDVLDCHSNGAMICLAAFANGDIKLTGKGPVRLLGPQITSSALKEWEQLAQKNHFNLEIYYNDGDPVPRFSYAAHELLSNASSVAQRLMDAPSVLKEVFAGTGLKDLVTRDAPSAKVTIDHCIEVGSFRYSVQCHEFLWYQRLYTPTSTQQ